MWFSFDDGAHQLDEGNTFQDQHGCGVQVIAAASLQLSGIELAFALMRCRYAMRSEREKCKTLLLDDV